MAQCDGQRVLLQDPSAPASRRPTIESVEDFARRWTGELILVSSRASLAGELAKFDFSWFIPSLVKHRKLLGEVLFISLMLQLFALVSPLFFQVVMDKVLVHRGLTTLDVLVAGLVVVVVWLATQHPVAFGIAPGLHGGAVGAGAGGAAEVPARRAAAALCFLFPACGPGHEMSAAA